MITIVAAFTRKNETAARKVFGAGGEEFIFGNMSEFSRFSSERLWELEKSKFINGPHPLEGYFRAGWLAGVVQYASREDFNNCFRDWNFDWDEFRVVEIR